MLQYQKARGGACQETCYNLGRYFDHLGLASKAVIFYEKALSMPLHSHEDPSNDLSFEAAYNLALLYKRSGNDILASYYMTTFCRI